MIIFSISELLFGLAQSINVFYISRGLGGIAAALIMPSVTAFVADMTTVGGALTSDGACLSCY